MPAPDLAVEIAIQDVTEWLKEELPAWATRTRHNASLVEREGTVVLTARNSTGDVGYAVLDRPMAHLHYMETRKDCR